jgi:hypothetical protein
MRTMQSRTATTNRRPVLFLLAVLSVFNLGVLC